MSHLAVLGVQIELVLLVACHLDRVSADNLDAVSVQTCDLHRVVGHKYQLLHPEIGKNRRPGAVFPEISCSL